MQDQIYMQEALSLAAKAAALGEVPVGALIVWEGQIVGRGYNLREQSKSPLAHAEILAIQQACQALGGWRLHKATLYVTLEPCPMCAGAIINARIPRVVYGASDPKAGSFGSVLDFNQFPYNHAPLVEGGCLEEQCARLLTEFFRELRERKKQPKPPIPIEV